MILIRADASPTIGTGHVMRCLALAQAAKITGEETIFLFAFANPTLEARIVVEGIKVCYLSPVEPGSIEDAQATAVTAQQYAARWVIVDGYNFGAAYQKIIKDAGLLLLVFDDDSHSRHYYADIILNQTVGANQEIYKNRELYTEMLLGDSYILLRQEFLAWQLWQRKIPTHATKILVTLGGSDPDNVTFMVIQALQHLDDPRFEAVIIVGGNNPNSNQFQQTWENSKISIRIKKNVTNMAELMAQADIAIASGGSTSLELAFMGLPTLLIILAENQRVNTETLAFRGISTNLGWYKDISSLEITHAVHKLSLSKSIRMENSRLGRELIDGKSAFRILSRMNRKLEHPSKNRGLK